MSQLSPTKDPLYEFTKLSHGQHWYKPPSSQGRAENSTPRPIQPDLIIFCAWGFAAPKHFLKYVLQYRSIYPDAQVLLLQSTMVNLAWMPDVVQMRELKSSVSAIADFLKTHALRRNAAATSLETTTPKKPTILVHAFSNGGGHSAIQLAQAYRETMRANPSSPSRPHLPAELPVTALVLDSSPGEVDFKIGIQVAMSAIPKSATLARILFTPVAYLMIAWIQGAHHLGITENVASKLWRCLNDVDGPFLLTHNGGVPGIGDRLGKSINVVPRTYIYSTRDELVRWQSVLEHAGEARDVATKALQASSAWGMDGNGDRAGADVENMIRLEGFPGSPHVNHVSVDPARYWRIVRETLEKSVLP